MNLTSADILVQLTARNPSSAPGVTGTGNVGFVFQKDFLAAGNTDIGYSFRVVSTGATDVATLTHSTGVVAQTTGTPTITNGAGNDWLGNDLPLATTGAVCLVAIQAKTTNTGTVTVAGADGLEAPSAILRAGGILVLAQPTQVAMGASSTMALTFSASGDQVDVWVLADQTP